MVIKVTIVLFILIFGIVVISHELGHFLLAKANGIHVVEFAIGMGPSLWSRKKGDTVYSIKLFPIGGACMFEGEDGVKTEEGEESEGSFLNASVWARISCVAAGPIFNFVVAFLFSLIIVSFAAIDLPIIGKVTEGRPIQEAGLTEGDRIISINGERVYLYREIMLLAQLNRGEPMRVVYERDKQQHEVQITPEYDAETGRYYMGIDACQYGESNGLDIFKYGYYQMRYSMKSTYKSLGMLLKGQVTKKDVAGPVGIAKVVGDTYETTRKIGWETVALNMMGIVVILSVSLGVMNLLPLPALDGGRLVFMLIELLRGKPVPPEKEGMVHFAGLVVLMILMVFILFNDISNIFA